NLKALRNAQSRRLTVGVIPKGVNKPLRLEIDDLLQDVELANLYFLALEAFMSKKVSESPFSYYEIGGIHGQPWRAWDGITSAEFGSSRGSINPQSGYCSHGSVVFPTWHRQALYLHAAEIAPKLRAQAALDRFRIPYFDPFLPRQKLASGDVYTYGLPIIFTLPQVQVRRPENPSRWVSMANPLYQFNFPADSKGGFDWSTYDQIPAARDYTIRGLNAATQSANHNHVMRAFDNAYNPVSGLSSQAPQSIWHVMFERQTWVQMSNHWDPRTRDPASVVYNANSLEGFHDNIHNQLATGPRDSSGHMGSSAFAGLIGDSNVDRLLSIWQGIHSRDPDDVAWWTNLEVPEGNFVEPGRLAETPQTPLFPFRKALTADSKPIWWTSNDCRNHLELGYDYPQTAAARRSGDIVRSLTAWANSQLGWLAPRSPEPADEGARTQLKRQINQSMPFFPSRVLIDGTTPLRNGQTFIGSMAAPTTARVSANNKLIFVPQRLVARTKAAVKIFSRGRRNTGTNERSTTSSITVRKPSDSRLTPQQLFSLDGSFTIFFFLGDFSPHLENWILDPHLAGSSGIFAHSRAAINLGACANCAKQDARGIKYMDTVALTPALLTYWDSQEEHYGCRVGDLSPDYALLFLIRNLHWRVVNIHSNQVPRETIPSLKVMVYSETVTLPHDIANKPHFEGQNVHYEVTNGRPGGLNTGEDM
ncbi:tyrosinase precursor, partial [Colletotrichum incanum]